MSLAQLNEMRGVGYALSPAGSLSCPFRPFWSALPFATLLVQPLTRPPLPTVLPSFISLSLPSFESDSVSSTGSLSRVSRPLCRCTYSPLSLLLPFSFSLSLFYFSPSASVCTSLLAFPSCRSVLLAGTYRVLIQRYGIAPSHSGALYPPFPRVVTSRGYDYQLPPFFRAPHPSRHGPSRCSSLPVLPSLFPSSSLQQLDRVTTK